MKLNLIGPFVVNNPFGTEIAFAKGLRRMGHEVIEVDPNLSDPLLPHGMGELDVDADATVVFKSCVGKESWLPSLCGPVVVYQPDDARFPHIRQMMVDMHQYSDLLLSFDEHGARIARDMGYRAAETLLLTADDELYCPSQTPIERDIDVCFIGSMGDPVAHASRIKMCRLVHEEASRRGWKTFFGTTQDIPSILEVYRRSKVVLNHATDVGQPFGFGYGYQCRHFEVAMTRTALLSNVVYGAPDPAKGRLLPFRTFNSEETLLGSIQDAIHGHELFGRWMYDAVMTAHRPNHRAVELIDFLERNL